MDTPQIIAGRFRVECEIGRGGMGTVYRASQLGLERPVAVKILKQEFAAYPEVAERFMREARTMSRLRHSRAAMIFDAGHLADGRPFIVMEYVEGATLAETLAREGTFAPERAVRVAAEICDVLAEAHALGIVHRDLKPSNIILNDRGVCVLDFGIAKVLQSSTEMTRTHATTESGLVIGTPRYMSPEQCLGHQVGPASDLYSVGVLLYEMLAGRTPFVDLLSSAVLVKQATAQPPPLMSLRPNVPRALALAVHTLLAKNPAHRPTGATEARRLLERSVEPERRAAFEGGSNTEPFAATVAALNSSRFTFTRVATLFAVLAIICAAVVGWSANAGQGARANALEEIVRDPDALASALAAKGKRRPARPAPLTRAAALRLAESLTHGRITDARAVETGAGQTIAAVGIDPLDRTRNLFVIERRGARGAFAVTSRTPLDVEGFRGADWTAETADLDGDGYEEVLCTGTSPRDDETASRRYVVFVPRTRETYSLHLAPDESRGARALRATWSPNTQGWDARLFRHALRQRAFN
ncbi:MAG TPA: serine/threonine-protein kinase [Pyrinomonadaceae bacterium]|nr:serine/threonine-protein kinase [Pyrinomonadaceae bacterium]